MEIDYDGTPGNCDHCGRDADDVYENGWLLVTVLSPSMSGPAIHLICARCGFELGEFLTPSLKGSASWISMKDQVIAEIRSRE